MSVRVLQIANGYLEKKLYRNLFDKLKLYHVDNDIFVPVKRGYKAQYNQEDKVIVKECFSELDRFFFFSKQWKILNAAKTIFDISQYDMIHAHTVFSNGFAAYNLHKEFGVPYIVAVRNTDIHIFFEKIIYLRKTGIEILNNAFAVIFISEAYREKLIEKYVPDRLKKSIRSKSVVIPNGIDDFFIENIADKARDMHDKVTIIHVGDVDHNKNITETMEAVKMLNKSGDRFQYKIVGEIKEKRLGEMIEKTEFISYHAKCGMEEVCEHYRDADILAMPSHYETFGLVYAEAMSQGIPVIYTKNQGFDGQYKDGVIGYAVDDRNASDLVNAIRLIVENYKEISGNCIKFAKEYDWKAIAKRYVSIYEGSVNGKI